jgi:hypothetical protein
VRMAVLVSVVNSGVEAAERVVENEGPGEEK